MTSVDVKTPAGKAAGTMELPADIFDRYLCGGYDRIDPLGQHVLARCDTDRDLGCHGLHLGW